MIQFNCPCGKSLHAREEYAGETTRCPDCGRELVIPGGQAVQADAPPRDRPDEEGVRRGRRGRRDDREDRPRPPTTSGMAITSAVLGVASLLCSIFTGLPALLFGVLGLVAIGRSNGRLKGKGLAVTGLVTGGLSLLLLPVVFYLGLLPAVWKVHEAAERMQSTNNLKQMGIAMHTYNDANGTFPAAAICDPNGKPLLSWRVAILPYVEGAGLYSQFKLDEPWDGPNNSRLLSQMPKVYAMPGDATAQPGYTYYRVFVGGGAFFDPPRPGQPFGLTRGPTVGDVPDGLSNTIMVAEAATAVPWTKPDELTFDPNGPPPALGRHHGSNYLVLMADGSVHIVPGDVSPATLRAAITRAGGETIDPDW